MIETLLRQPRRATVDYREIADRSLALMMADRSLRLVSATGPNLLRLGTTFALSTGPYEPCAQWADALFDHPDTPDGILFGSRHNPEELCIALFEKPDIALTVVETVPLTSHLKQVGEILDRHGKSLYGGP